MTDTDRRKILRERLEMFHELYMRASVGSTAEARWGRLVIKTEAELDEIFREEQEEWGRDDDRILRQQIADRWPS